MATDAYEFSTCDDEQCLRELSSLIQQAAERASREDQKFLAYLLEMAHMEANMLLIEKQSQHSERP